MDSIAAQPSASRAQRMLRDDVDEDAFADVLRLSEESARLDALDREAFQLTLQLSVSHKDDAVLKFPDNLADVSAAQLEAMTLAAKSRRDRETTSTNRDDMMLAVRASLLAAEEERAAANELALLMRASHWAAGPSAVDSLPASQGTAVNKSFQTAGVAPLLAAAAEVAASDIAALPNTAPSVFAVADDEERELDALDEWWACDENGACTKLLSEDGPLDGQEWAMV